MSRIACPGCGTYVENTHFHLCPEMEPAQPATIECTLCGWRGPSNSTHLCLPNGPKPGKRGCSFASNILLTAKCPDCGHMIGVHETPGKVCAICRDMEPLQRELEALKKRPGASIFGRVMEEFGFDSEGDLHHEVCDMYIPVDLWTPTAQLDVEGLHNAPMKEIMQTAITHLQSKCPGREPK